MLTEIGFNLGVVVTGIGDAFLTNGLNFDSAEIANVDFPNDYWKVGQTDVSEYVTANRWTLVKIHLDTSSASGRYEAWMRPSLGSWVKVVEWINGVTPGFTWNIYPAYQGGHRTFRMPSTFGQASPAPRNYDAWIYMDDFAMATTESALPIYPWAPPWARPPRRARRVR